MLLGSLSSSAFTFSSSYLSPAYFPGPSRSIPSTSLAACFTSTSSDFLSISDWSAFFPEIREHPLLKTRQRISIHENACFTVPPPIFFNSPYEYKPHHRRLYRSTLSGQYNSRSYFKIRFTHQIMNAIRQK